MTATEPQSDTPQTQTALDLWNEQLAGLTDPAQADSAINIIHERLMKLHGGFIKNEMQKQAGQVEEAYNLAVQLYNETQQRQAIIAGGAAAIQEAEAQRDKVTNELQSLLTAIEDGDEEHPVLAEYASDIRDSESAVMETIFYDDQDIHLTEQLMETWDWDYEKAGAVLQAVFGNGGLSAHQEQLFRAFAAAVAGEDEANDDSDD